MNNQLLYVKPFHQLTIRERINKLIDMSHIRCQKLLEISQYVIIYFIIGLFAGIFLEKLFPKDDDISVKTKSTFLLFLLILIQSITYAIISFYIYKIARIVPFLFHYTKDYIPSLKNESIFGGTVALSIIFYSMQTSLIKRITEFSLRLTK